MTTDRPRKPDDSARPGASTPRTEADKRSSRGTGRGESTARQTGPRDQQTSQGGKGQDGPPRPQRPPGPGSSSAGPKPSAQPSAPGGVKPSGATAASAGGLSKGGSPETGGPGRGTKSLGVPGGAGTPGTPGTAGAPAGAFSAQAVQGGPSTQGSPGMPGGGAAVPGGQGAAGAAAPAGTPGGAKQALDAVGKDIDGMAANAAGAAAQKAVSGKGEGTGREPAGRYAGAATSGAVAGASKGGLPGAAIGAAKNVAVEGGKDAIDGAGRITGGGPVAEPADKRLGAGGTSYERGGPDQDGESSGAKTGRLAAGGAAAAAPPAMGLAMLLALMAWLKSMFFMMLAMAANLGNLFLQFLLGVAKAVIGFVAKPFVAVGGFVAKAAGAIFGTAVAATVAPVAAVGSGVVATVTAAALIGSIFGGVLNQTALTDGRVQPGRANCVVNASSKGGGGQVSAGTEQNAQKVYSVLKTWGMPNENIAGILGNWSQESGIDPTSVEGIYDEPYTIGPRKQAAWDGNFTQIPGQEHGGIGLGQWSNGRTPMLLDYAKSKGLDWYTIEAQLAFMAQGDNPSDVAAFKAMIKTSQGSPGRAAVYFHSNWERSADNAQGLAEREADADMWFGKMSGWSVDSSVAGGVKGIVGIAVVGSVADGVNTILGNCDSKGKSGNVALADGGMNQEQAQALVDLYNEEGDKFLDAKYGENGGPGSCGSNHAMNCVSFSTYFVNKYTSFQQYAPGDGIRTAYAIAEMTGKEVSNTPKAYSVGSGPGSGPAGHTLVVLGVDGDKLIVGEAGYCSNMGQVRVAGAAEMKAAGWVFLDVSDLIAKGGDLPKAA